MRVALSCSWFVDQEFRQSTGRWLDDTAQCSGPQLGGLEWLEVSQTAGGWSHLKAPHLCVWHLGRNDLKTDLSSGY